jgi:hypothetical protein
MNDYKKSISSTSINRIFIEIIFIFSFFIVTSSSFAQSDSSNNSTDQTMKNMSQSANQTVYAHLRHAANQNGGNASDSDDSNFTEKIKNIGKNLWKVQKTPLNN